MNKISLRLFLFQGLCLLFATHSLAGEDGKDGGSRDSLSSQELGTILQKKPLTLPYLQDVADSLKNRDRRRAGALRELKSYMKTPVVKKERILGMIDTLLNGDKVDRERMQGIRILIAKWRARMRSPFMIPYGSSPHPASSLLTEWNTRNIAPYKRSVHARERKVRLIAPEWECGFQIPVDGELTSAYGIRDGRLHAGVDIDLFTGDPVEAAFSGMVRVSRYFKGYGRVVLIRHHNGLETLYAHLHRALAEPGERVEAGERIGTGGNTGHSTGSHLHFEVRYQGTPLNPAHFISFDKGKLLGDTLVLDKKEQKRGIAAYPAGTRFHEVGKGDFLYKIAERYGTSVQRLCELNSIHRNSTLWVGQRLRVSS